MVNTLDMPKILGKFIANGLVINVHLSFLLAAREFGEETMAEGSQFHLASRAAAAAVRPAKKQILRAHMTALARRLYGPDSPGHRELAVDILRARRRSAGR